MFLKHSNVAVSIRIDKAQSKLFVISVSDFWFLHAMMVSSVRGEKRYGGPVHGVFQPYKLRNNRRQKCVTSAIFWSISVLQFSENRQREN